jgi:hypothetical protein
VTQAPLFLAIFLIGLPVALALGPRRYPALCCALAFQVGLSVTVFASLLLLVAGIPFSEWTLGPLAVAAAVAAVWWRPVRLDRATIGLIAASTAGFAAVSAALSYYNLSAMSFDSHHIVMLGRIIGNDHALEGRTLAELQSWGVFQVVAQSFMAFTLQDYLYSLQPVFGAAFLPVFALSLWHAVGRLGATGWVRGASVALITVALFTLYVFLIHLVFIHTNLGTAVYLFSFVVLFWLAELDQDPSGLPLAFLCLLSLALQRLETPVVALIALIATALTTDLPRRTITPLLAVFTAIVSGWYFQLAFHLEPRNPFLTPRRSVILSVVVAGFFVWWLLSTTTWIRRINLHMHQIASGVFLAALGFAFATAPEHMATSVESWWINLTQLPHWGYAWWGLGAALAVGLLIPPPPRHRAFTLTIWLSLAYWLFLAYAREPYRVALLDSANRMTIHIVPLFLFYLGIKAIPGVMRRDAAE